MKPQFRGYLPQIAFFLAVFGSTLLIFQSKPFILIPNIIYCLTLIGLYGISSLYHRPVWSRRNYLIIKRIDHSAIFALIAGTATPICIVCLNDKTGMLALIVFWILAILGMFLTLFWTHSPKWLRAFLYITLGWYFIPFFAKLQLGLGIADFELLLIGGILYTVGAIGYAFKFPNLYPDVFGYHEFFHLFTVIASILHFIVIYNLTMRI